MRISLQWTLKSKYNIDFGYETPFHSCMYWFTIIREDMDEFGNHEYAEWIFGAFKHYKYWKL